MVYALTSSEYVEIDGVPLQTPAWLVTNLYTLWSGPATRGQDLVLPGVPGVRPYRRRATATRRTLEMVVYGHVDWAGGAYSDLREGLQANIDHLRQATDPVVSTSAGTRTALLYMPDSSIRSANVQVEAFELGGGLGSFATLATMDLTIVDGFTAVGWASS
jgi:hypothetical protein